MSLLLLPDELIEKTFLQARKARKNGSRALCSMLTVCRRTSVSYRGFMLESLHLIEGAGEAYR
jgi:hypothetical protein